MTERRLVGEHFNRDGLPKRGFPDYLTAYMIGLEHDLVAYECSVCGQWHLATPPDPEAEQPKQRRRRRRR